MAIRPSTLLPSLLVSFACACAATGAHAAELGEARVLSHIGQPLVADVELTLIEDTATPVGVRLADPNVYRVANLRMPPVLGSLDMAVTRRAGKQFLHLTSLKPVDSRHLHVYLELADGAQRSVRLVTLWLTPDPNPAPPPTVQAQLAAAVTVLPAAPAPARPPVTEAPQGAELRPQEHPAARPRMKPPARPQRAPQATPAAVPLLGEAPPPACAPQASAQESACVALGAKNAALRQTLDGLEDRVKGLQAAHGIVPAAPATAPKEAPRIQLKPKKPAAPEPETPWLLIGGAVGAILALGAGLVLWRRRRRGAPFGKLPKVAAPAGPEADEQEGVVVRRPGFLAALKARLLPARRRNAAGEGALQSTPLASEGAAEPVPAAAE